jgi:hypothetical protein
MMITNNPKQGDKTTELLRAAFGHRALWLYLLVEAAKKRGVDPEFAREAVFQCGCIQAQALPDVDDPKEFGRAFVKPENARVFDMETHEEEDAFVMDFHYCPLVAAWQKMTGDETYIAWLCDIAMAGDRGIADRYKGKFEISLGPRIAYGDRSCQIRFTRCKKD